MADSALAKKIQLKPGMRAAVINAPQGYLKELGSLPENVRVADSLSGKSDWVQVFVQNKAELAKLMPRIIRALFPESLLWISFPKGSSKI